MSYLRESRELREEEEEPSSDDALARQNIRQIGAGGNDLEEIEIDIFSSNAFNYIAVADFSPFVHASIYFSIKIYHTYLLQTLYFPKLYIFFHCAKVFLF